MHVAVRRALRVQLTHEALVVLGGANAWVPRERVLAVGRWAAARRAALEAVFPQHAVGKLRTGDMAVLRDAATFLRQLLRHSELHVCQRRKGRDGQMERHNRVVG